jgi:N-acetylneuraminic acid mutarotase
MKKLIITALTAISMMLHADELPPLPEAVTSFGAVVQDEWLYVYGGHMAGSHAWSLATTSGAFHRLNLAKPEKWEKLAGGPQMQSPGLAAHAGKIYLVGGMQPQNATEKDKSLLKSLNHAAVFDAAAGTWSKLPDLPEPRSSHDIAVLDGKLYVVGGWPLNTGDDSPKEDDKEGDKRPFHTTMLVLDLADTAAGWKSLPQPFQRRALAIAACKGKLYCIGGMNEKNEVSASANVFSPSSNSWSVLPDLSADGKMKAFGTAVCVLDDRVIASPGGGKVFALSTDRKAWVEVAQLKTQRYFHQLEAWRNNEVIALGGTKAREPQNSMEIVRIAEPEKK